MSDRVFALLHFSKAKVNGDGHSPALQTELILRQAQDDGMQFEKFR